MHAAQKKKKKEKRKEEEEINKAFMHPTRINHINTTNVLKHNVNTHM
jgi:hypothetical protein